MKYFSAFESGKPWSRSQVEGKLKSSALTMKGNTPVLNLVHSYLTKEGIKQELTIPHSPQQNGAAERLNLTPIEGVRTMLANLKLPHRFWVEALSMCVYLRNRNPTKALEGIMPYEAWNEIKPDVSLLRIFGCSAYAHVPKVERNKLDYKTRKCVLLGYGTSQKGYRLYDVECMKVVHSRDVVFDETSTPGIRKETIVKYVELEVNEEPYVECTTTPNSPDGVSDEIAENEQLSEESLPGPYQAVPRSQRPKCGSDLN